ncbi:MAG: fibronectin/fibrinogen-binding protein [Clostridiaceae bacterium]|nr:NFACT RNA binding domain-containing protein [Bacillota bacterium]NLP07344.1 fibronectin/fibrinogen-binding protein [Clostridiaceae bacterium]HOA54060.1 NFACT RNA binding domain-containing protein [Clostridiales bacterium]HPZ06064.1 NFACT RNA binding domain-containing protein [Clostridiales bacterium]HQD30204.1 NFACT RNA binding domain-containing protein [Clostridiales bacterium]
MPFDGIVAKCIVRELSKELSGGRIDKVLQPEADEIVLVIRAQGKNHRLLLSASPRYPRIHITETVKENPSVAPSFCMLLRKHLTRGRIHSFEFNDYERVIGLNIEAVSELGDISSKKLVIEIMGRHSNIILLNENDRILDSIKHVDSDVSSVREVMPARQYILPPSQDKISPSHLDTAQLTQLLDFSSKPVERFLLDNIKGFSPLLCREVCYRAGIDGKRRTGGLTAEERISLETALHSVIKEIRNDEYLPAVYFEDEQCRIPLDFHCLDIKQYAFREQSGSISHTLDRFYNSRDKAERLRQKKADLFKLLNNSIDRCTKKLAIQQDALREAADREKLRLYGELITASIYAIPKNAKSVSLMNYYSENGEYIDIPLDPNLSPQANAQIYFRKYAKAKSTHIYTTRQLEQTQIELDYLESVLQMLDNCTSVQEIDEIRQELSDQGYMVQKRRRHGKKAASATEPLHYRSSDGFDILVGKNNTQNDRLTFKIAQSGDIWLHTKSVPGSHVIIRKSGREIPDRTIEQAAMIAAWHSKARMSSNVRVDYTAVKNVSKPSGAKPGMVVYVNYMTAIVTPDQYLVESLRV